MAAITLDNIAHCYAQSAELALHPISMEWRDGGAYALLGPSGCGKTTLLNIISGLLGPSEGRVLFGDNDVTALPPQLRNIAQVFQFPVVYDSMTVAENLEFPLRNAGLPTPERQHRVKEVLELLDLGAVADQRARNLGADLKQKISLGRGLVRTEANAILFDEPLTVIDPALKWELRAQLKKVHQQVGHTMIYVTHDQTEALTFADEVVVMQAGKVLQVGTPQALFERPEHTFVGSFIGSPGMNLLPCRVSGSVAHIENQPINLGAHYPALSGTTELGVRPEHLRLVGAESSAEALAVRLVRVEDLGREKIAHLTLAGHPVAVMLQEHEAIPEQPALEADTRYLHVYENSARVPVAEKEHTA